MHFDLTDLRLFVLVAAERNLTRAAARQHLSLAAASARIKALEAQAQLPLLQRGARGVALTPAGDAFLHHAREVLHQTELLCVDLHEYGSGLRGLVRVAANTTAVADFLPDILPAFLAGHPRANVELRETPNADIARSVAQGRADMGISSGRLDTLGLQAIYFSTDRLVVITSRRHRLARRRHIRFEEVLDEEAVGMHQGSTLQTFLADESGKLGKQLKLRIQLSSFDAVCRMVGAGVGVSVMPESAARRNLEALGLAQIELKDPWSVRERFILVRDEAALPPLAKALVKAICAHYQAPSR